MTGATTTWVTKWASDSSFALRRSTSSGYTPLSLRPAVGYTSTFSPAASVGSASNANGVRLRDGGRLPPFTLWSNAVRDCNESWTVSTTCAPAGTSVARNLMRKSPFGATHALCPASANVGTACAPAGAVPVTSAAAVIARIATAAASRLRARTASRLRARTASRGSQRPAEDAQARGEDVEPERAVQRERRVRSPTACSRRRGRRPASRSNPGASATRERPHPREPGVGVHRDALQVAVAAGDTGDRVGDDPVGVVADPEAARGRRVDGVLEARPGRAARTRRTMRHRARARRAGRAGSPWPAATRPARARRRDRARADGGVHGRRSRRRRTRRIPWGSPRW